MSRDMQEKIELIASEARRFHGIALTERDAKFYNDLGDLLARVAADLRLESYQRPAARLRLVAPGPPAGKASRSLQDAESQ